MNNTDNTDNIQHTHTMNIFSETNNSVHNEEHSYNNESNITIIKLRPNIKIYIDNHITYNTLINNTIEKHDIVRKIIAHIPKKLIERLIYLEKFLINADDKEKYKKLKYAVYKSYIIECRLRCVFRKLLHIWRKYRMDKSYVKEIDVITLIYPDKELCIYDWAVKKKFVFDAKSLSNCIESRLLYQESGFSMPLNPRNPRTNVDFTYIQLIEIYNQLHLYGELRWAFTTLKQYNFNITKWSTYNKSTLTINAIRTSITILDSVDSRDLFLDFIFSRMDDLEITYNNIIYNQYSQAMILMPNHWYLDRLKSLAIIHYESEHFGNDTSRLIDIRFKRIIRKQTQFFNDLRDKKDSEIVE